MAVLFYDILEGKWYLELANSERISCEDKDDYLRLKDAPQEEFEEYGRTRETRHPRLRLQTIEETQE